jgi:membrane protein YdbS with pleckstrin-like domain
VTPPASALEPWPATVEWRAVSPRLIALKLISLGIGIVIILAALIIAGQLWTLGWVWPAIGAVVVFTVLRVAAIIRGVRSWGYAEREDDLLVRHGLFTRHLSIVPYARMQFVDVSASPLERALGLATVQLHTAAAASDARVPGLLPADAARLRDRLTALGETRAEGL